MKMIILTNSELFGRIMVAPKANFLIQCKSNLATSLNYPKTFNFAKFLVNEKPSKISWSISIIAQGIFIVVIKNPLMTGID